MPTLEESKVISNDLDNFTTPAIGPEQARARVKSCEYISFDYNGQLKDDPVISVKMLLEPQDGENDGKDFEVLWTTGGKMSEFSIVNDGGNLLPTQARSALTNTSNWSLLQKSLKDCGFNTRLLDGTSGIRYFAEGDGAILVLKHVNQPDRAGLEAKNTKGFDKKYYTCLKIDSLPGEKRGARKAAPAKPAAMAPATANAPAPASVSNGSGVLDITAIAKQAIDAGGGSVKIIPDLQKAIFMAAKASGEPVNRCATISKGAVEEAAMAKLAADNQWIIDEGVLAG